MPSKINFTKQRRKREKKKKTLEKKDTTKNTQNQLWFKFTKMLSNCLAFLAFVVSARLSAFFLCFFLPFLCMFFSHCTDLFLALFSRSCGLTGNKIFFIFLLFSDADLHPIRVPFLPFPPPTRCCLCGAGFCCHFNKHAHTHTESKKKVT